MVTLRSSLTRPENAPSKTEIPDQPDFSVFQPRRRLRRRTRTVHPRPTHTPHAAHRSVDQQTHPTGGRSLKTTAKRLIRLDRLRTRQVARVDTEWSPHAQTRHL